MSDAPADAFVEPAEPLYQAEAEEGTFARLFAVVFVGLILAPATAMLANVFLYGVTALPHMPRLDLVFLHPVLLVVTASVPVSYWLGMWSGSDTALRYYNWWCNKSEVWLFLVLIYSSFVIVMSILLLADGPDLVVSAQLVHAPELGSLSLR